jgi:diguanylate cyclase (GGDEF)-like protein
MEGLADIISQQFLNSMFRDIVGILEHELRGNDLVARYSQYQFSILLPATPGKAAYQTLGRIRNLIAKKPVDLGGVEMINIEPVVGVASSVDQTESVSAILERAEQALDDAMESDEHIHLHKVDPFV